MSAQGDSTPNSRCETFLRIDRDALFVAETLYKLYKLWTIVFFFITVYRFNKEQ